LSLLIVSQNAAPAELREASAEGRTVFEQAKDKLLQIRVVHKATGAQASMGSGFLASADGLVLTNYHVVADVALEPKTYALEFERSDGTTGKPRLLVVDVANDLAVLATDLRGQPFLAIRAAPLEKGDRGFALGHPLHLGPAIVEGTYNGYVEATAIPRIHFTGAVNSGMSGGPAITSDGAVFGVNVSRMWLQQLVSFLVPAEAAAELLRRAQSAGEPPADFRKEVGAQLLAQQARVFERLLAEPVKTSAMGRYTVPDAAGPLMRCWGAALDEPELLYGHDFKVCSLRSGTYVTDGLQTGELRFVHSVLEARGLGRCASRASWRSATARRRRPPASCRTGRSSRASAVTTTS
jgi:S1-C subfamily serine protease